MASVNSVYSFFCSQACAIESAARVNPNWNIFVLFASPVGFANDSSLHSPSVHALKAYSNVFFRNVHLWTYAAGTPFQHWMMGGRLFESEHFVAHTSDYLRFLSLFRFGGICMDLDVIVQKSFENIEQNFAAATSKSEVGSSILSLTQSFIGRKIASLCAR